MVENLVVPEALDDTNYEIWSNCMEIYLLSQDLWDVMEPEAEADESSSKNWRRKNALALHAIHMSCGNRATLSKICGLKSAKEVWDLLRSMNQQSHHDSEITIEKKQLDDSSHSDQVREPPVTIKVPSSQVDDGIETKTKPRQKDEKVSKNIDVKRSQQAMGQSTAVKVNLAAVEASRTRRSPIFRQKPSPKKQEEHNRRRRISTNI